MSLSRLARLSVLVAGLLANASCGARGGVLDGDPGADGTPDPEPALDPDPDLRPDPDPDPGIDPEPPDPERDPRVIHRHLCERVLATRDDAVSSPECVRRWDEAARAMLPEGGVFESAVLRLEPGTLRVSEIALEGAAYGSFGRRDHAVLDEAEGYLPMGVEPEIWSPDNGSHLIAVRRAEAPAGSVVVSPLLAARTGVEDGAITSPGEWRNPDPLDQDCPSTVTLEACGLDVRTGTELPEEVTRAALEAVLGTVLPDLIVRGAYIFDTMVVRWAPTTSEAGDDDAGELFVVIAGGWLE